MWLSLVAPTFKDAQYESEREWRLVRVRFGEDDEQLASPVQYRLRGGEAMPFVARKIAGKVDDALSLVRILCGARLSDTTVAEIRQLAEKRFPGCEITKSSLAFRRRGG